MQKQQSQINFFAKHQGDKEGSVTDSVPATTTYHTPHPPSYPSLPQDDSGSENSRSSTDTNNININPDNNESVKKRVPFVPPQSLIERATGKAKVNKKKHGKKKSNDNVSSSEENSVDLEVQEENEEEEEDTDQDEKKKAKIIHIGQDYCQKRIDVEEILGVREKPVVIVNKDNPDKGDHYYPINGLYSLLRGIKIRGKKSRSTSPFYIKGLDKIKIYSHSTYHEMFNCKDLSKLRIRERGDTNIKRIGGNMYERCEDIFFALQNLYKDNEKKPKVVPFRKDPIKRKSDHLGEEEEDESEEETTKTANNSSRKENTLKSRKTEFECLKFNFTNEEWKKFLQSVKGFDDLCKSGKVPSDCASFILDKASRYFDNANFKFKHMENKARIGGILKKEDIGDSDDCSSEL